MGKYLLQSGGLVNQPERGRVYFKEMFADAPENPKLLWCFFAGLSKKTVRESLEFWRPKLKPLFPNHVVCNEQNAEVATFYEQCAWADIIYIHGGSLDDLLKAFTSTDLESLFADKVVALNSASGMLFAQTSWSCDTFNLREGLGILPLKFLPHFRADTVPNGSVLTQDVWDEAFVELEAYGDTTLPVYALEEGEFVVFEQ